MAVVYRGYDTRLDVVRAIKVLHPRFGRGSSVRKRFEREARMMANITHPNLVTITDVDWDERHAWIVMELLNGSLEQRLVEHGPLPPRLGCEVIRGVLGGLGAAHAAGVIHRDVKPANILLSSQGVPKLSDFGVARMSHDGGQTQTGAVLGTRAFMAPEQRHGARQVTLQSDLFATGATLFNLITGTRPTDIDNPKVTDSLLDELPEPLRPFLTKATAYHPEDRFADAREMGDALRAIEEELHEPPEDFVPLGSTPQYTDEITPETEARTFQTLDSLTPSDEAWQPQPTPTSIAPQGTATTTRGPGTGWTPWLAVGLTGVLLISGTTLVVDRLVTSPPPTAPQAEPAPPSPDPMNTDPAPQQAPAPLPPEPVDTPTPPDVQQASAIELPEDLAATPAPRTGELVITGAATKVELIAGDGTRHPPGVVPAGTYTLMASFENRDKPVDVGPVTIPAGHEVHLVCHGAGYYRCVPPR